MSSHSKHEGVSPRQDTGARTSEFSAAANRWQPLHIVAAASEPTVAGRASAARIAWTEPRVQLTGDDPRDWGLSSRDRLPTWVGRPSLQFHEGLFFAPYTFSSRSRALLRAPKGKICVLVRITYSDTTTRPSCGNSCPKTCKVEPQPYTYFTPPQRTNAISRSTIGAVMSGSARRTARRCKCGCKTRRSG